MILGPQEKNLDNDLTSWSVQRRTDDVRRRDSTPEKSSAPEKAEQASFGRSKGGRWNCVKGGRTVM